MIRPNLVNAETLCCIARLGTFQAAAERLHTTQPAVSARMKELEQSLGTRLFQRRGRGVELTMEARRFVERVEPLLRAVEGVFAEANSDSVAGTVRIGLGDISMTWFASIICQLRKALPRVAYQIEMDLASNLRHQLEAGKLDLMIMAGQLNSESLICQPLGSTRLLWIGATGVVHDASGKKRDTADILQNSLVWTVPRTSVFFPSTLRKLKDMGANMDNICTCNSIAGIIQMVERGTGLGHLPEIMVRQQLASGKLVVIDPTLPSTSLDFTLAYHRDEDQSIVQMVAQTALKMSKQVLDAPDTTIHPSDDLAS